MTKINRRGRLDSSDLPLHLTMCFNNLIIMLNLIKSIFSSAQKIAYVDTDEFRLSRKNLWTEANHPREGGSIQRMRIDDENVVLISISIETIKIFISPLNITDLSQLIELKSIIIKNRAQRLSAMSRQDRIAEDLLLLEKLRKAISWPNSLNSLRTNVNNIPEYI